MRGTVRLLRGSESPSCHERVSRTDFTRPLDLSGFPKVIIEFETHIASIIITKIMSLTSSEAVLTFRLVEHVGLKVLAARSLSHEVLFTSIRETHGDNLRS